MSKMPNEGLDMLLALLAKQAAEEWLNDPNSHIATEVPPLPEEIHDHPKPIVRHPDGSISVLIK
ncbi:MAG: hypothetical protein WBF84_06695 [Castellaniella sp.]|uniref:hypothetical protein n=1 Tax=Castellaniella sp. TaxID=1955812 RepID=UPI003C7915CB